MSKDDLRFVSLRKYPEYLEETANLLNSQWSRSLSARLHSLSECSNDFPCSLILLQTDLQGSSRVIGHSRLSQVLGKPKAALVECVIVEKTRRGSGLGRWIMELTEAHASKLGCTAIYLSTTDKCQFYEHLGYQYCSHVSPVRASASRLTSSQHTVLQECFGESIVQEKDKEETQCSTESYNKECKNNMEKLRTSDSRVIVPEIGEQFNCNHIDCNSTIKECPENLSPSSSSSSFSQPTVIHPPPPPPPLPLPTPPNKTLANPLKTVWMMKEIS